MQVTGQHFNMKVVIQLAVLFIATTSCGPRFGNQTEHERWCLLAVNRADPGCLPEATTTLSPLQRAQNRKADNLINRIDNWYQEWDSGKFLHLDLFMFIQKRISVMLNGWSTY